uniref:Uncharacterized protein n=1 Tax=Chaetoceros debilis TaxID=122233 RepID=A0A7S3PVC9_9STRA
MAESVVSNGNFWEVCNCDTTIISMGVLLVSVWAVVGLGHAILSFGDASPSPHFNIVYLHVKCMSCRCHAGCIYIVLKVYQVQRILIEINSYTSVLNYESKFAQRHSGILTS